MLDMFNPTYKHQKQGRGQTLPIPLHGPNAARADAARKRGALESALAAAVAVPAGRSRLRLAIRVPFSCATSGAVIATI